MGEATRRRVADLDGDGLTELVATAEDGTIHVWTGASLAAALR